MSTAGTMARVYQALKARVMAGEFAPGERIDPARLSIDLAASATPIRDALYRLAGERLVESWQHEGFRQPFVSEATLRDLYGWSEDLLRIILRFAERSAMAPAERPVIEGGLPDAISGAFAWLAQLSANHEHAAAIASLNDRLHHVRIIEQRILAEAEDEIELLWPLVDRRQWADVRRWSASFHVVRQRHVPEIAAAFRRRET
ncbi:GntR family transcriptional regulator [Sphingomonas donggukensis]|uniref:GntR family transcriptional regulator n=1 Tax=Sphingomonas donggukensis TaxID=2949093 RepID=A0ABY4TUD5_9SPHN|nr:GntR family transcriptional regulator [Sphingomonas donggukensis]URW75892.1 GntR family transcriptional regulator [Sphingomonas donggukensis]